MRTIENVTEFMRQRLSGRSVEIHTVGAPGNDIGIRPGVLLVAAGLALGMLAVPGQASAQDNGRGRVSITARDVKAPTAVAPIQMGRVSLGQAGLSHGSVSVGNVVVQGDGAVVVIGNNVYSGNQIMTQHDLTELKTRNADTDSSWGKASMKGMR